MQLIWTLPSATCMDRLGNVAACISETKSESSILSAVLWFDCMCLINCRLNCLQFV
jgi:hypothetical protein